MQRLSASVLSRRFAAATSSALALPLQTQTRFASSFVGEAGAGLTSSSSGAGGNIPNSGFGGGNSQPQKSTYNPAMDSSFVKCIDKEIEDEELRLDKEPPNIPKGWEISHAEGTSYFIMTRHWVTPKGVSETHTVRAMLTARDTSLDPEFDIRGEHFPFTLVIRNDQSDEVVDLTCDVVESEFVVNGIKAYPSALLATDVAPSAQFDRDLMYPGPPVDETEDELLDALQVWLAEREFDDVFAEFIAQYHVWTEQLEYERWLKELKGFLIA